MSELRSGASPVDSVGSNPLSTPYIVKREELDEPVSQMHGEAQQRPWSHAESHTSLLPGSNAEAEPDAHATDSDGRDSEGCKLAGYLFSRHISFGDMDAEATDLSCSGDVLHVNAFIAEIMVDPAFLACFDGDEEFRDVKLEGSPCLMRMAHNAIMNTSTFDEEPLVKSLSPFGGVINRIGSNSSTKSVGEQFQMQFRSRDSCDRPTMMLARKSTSESPGASQDSNNPIVDMSSMMSSVLGRTGLSSGGGSPYLSGADSFDQHDVHPDDDPSDFVLPTSPLKSTAPVYKPAPPLPPPVDPLSASMRMNMLPAQQRVRAHLSVKSIQERSEALEKVESGGTSDCDNISVSASSCMSVSSDSSTLTGERVTFCSLYDIFLIRLFLMSAFEHSDFRGTNMEDLAFDGDSGLVNGAVEVATGLFLEAAADELEELQSSDASSLESESDLQFPCPDVLLKALSCPTGETTTTITDLTAQTGVEIFVEDCPHPSDCMSVIHRVMVRGQGPGVVAALRGLDTILNEALSASYLRYAVHDEVDEKWACWKGE